MASSKYKSYMRSPEWQRKRTAVIARARGVCERCGVWPIVNVHHLTYERLGAEELSDLLGVCSKCHRELHNYENTNRNGSDLRARPIRPVA